MRKRLLATALAASLAAGWTLLPEAASAQETGAEAPRLTGRFLLIDHNGRPVSDESFGGKVRVMTFGYTHCPDICPTTLGTMSVAMDRLGRDAGRVAWLFVTVDPARDTSSHLKEYLSAFPGITGLTGSADQVAGAARAFRVRYELHRPEGADPTAYAVDHSAGIYVMDGDGRFVAKLGHMASGDELAERIRAALR